MQSVYSVCVNVVFSSWKSVDLDINWYHQNLAWTLAQDLCTRYTDFRIDKLQKVVCDSYVQPDIGIIA